MLYLDYSSAVFAGRLSTFVINKHDCTTFINFSGLSSELISLKDNIYITARGFVKM